LPIDAAGATTPAVKIAARPLPVTDRDELAELIRVEPLK
jgi:hypothetical protein